MRFRFKISPRAHLDAAVALTPVGVPLTRYDMCKGDNLQGCKKNRALIFVASEPY